MTTTTIIRVDITTKFLLHSLIDVGQVNLGTLARNVTAGARVESAFLLARLLICSAGGRDGAQNTSEFGTAVR